MTVWAPEPTNWMVPPLGWVPPAPRCEGRSPAKGARAVSHVISTRTCDADGSSGLAGSAQVWLIEAIPDESVTPADVVPSAHDAVAMMPCNPMSVWPFAESFTPFELKSS